MAKNVLQDMVRVKKPQIRPMVKERPIYEASHPNKYNEEILPKNIKRNTNKSSKYRIFFIAFIAVLFLLFALSFLFSGAKVTIVPKVKDIQLNDNITANKDFNASGLSFDLVVISGEEGKSIQGGEVKDTSIKATGIVLVYNSSSASQNLDIDTRLEASNGKIYKTNKKITVPGMTKDGKIGSVEVGIYASEGGEAYNSGPLDFKILGFKGTAKYTKFYARSKGDISGGFKGKSPVVSSLDKISAVNELKATLEARLSRKVTDQIPSGFILYKDATFVSINDKDITYTPDADNKVLVKVKGNLYGFIFDQNKLSQKIAQDVVDKYAGESIYIPNIKDLDFALVDKASISFADVKSINFTLTGIPKIIWKVDEAKFVDDVLGKKKTEFNQILAKYGSIDSAELVLRPFWKSSFPEKSKSIKIVVNYPK